MKSTRSAGDFQIRSELKRVGRGLPFSKIEIGEVYHIPPILEYPRKDILVESKVVDESAAYLSCTVECEGKTTHEWIHDFELQAKYIVPFKREKKKIQRYDRDDLPF